MGKASSGARSSAKLALFQRLRLTNAHKLAKEKLAPQVAQEFEALADGERVQCCSC